MHLSVIHAISTQMYFPVIMEGRRRNGRMLDPQHWKEEMGYWENIWRGVEERGEPYAILPLICGFALCAFSHLQSTMVQTMLHLLMYHLRVSIA